MATQYIIRWKRKDADIYQLTLPRTMNELEARALAAGAVLFRLKDVELWKEEDITTVEKIKLEEG